MGTAIRSFFARAPEVQAAQLRRGGMPSSERAGLPYNLASQFGYDSLAQHLRVDQDLQARFSDYEEMDEYPEISCLHGDSPVFTLERGWVQIRDMVGQNFHVIAYDKERRSLVPAEGTALLSAPEGHHKPMVRVTLDNGEQIVCTADHPFLAKDEQWIEAGDLVVGQRLMPGNLRLRSLNDSSASPYWQIHQPHADSEICSSDGKRWVWLHHLVAEEMLSVERGEYQVVHHENHDQLNNDPSNLSIETRSTHAGHHIADIDNSRFFPEWTGERRLQQAEKMRGNTQPNRIDISRAKMESALSEGGTVAGAAEILGISWSMAKRRAVAFDLVSDGGNHRVLRVEHLDESPAVYDLHVPGFHNFVCHGVVVHNTALDLYADDATIPDMERNQSVWVTSSDNSTSKELNHMLHKQLLVESDNWGLARTLGKYGNGYGEALVSEQGLVGISFLPPPTCRRVEGPKGQLLGFIQDTRGEFNLSLEDFYKLAKQRGTNSERTRGQGELTVFEDWELIHWRLRGKHLRSVYGHGVIDPARWIWKRLALLEDALLIYKLSRAPSRYAFYVDIGELDGERGLAYVNRVKNQFVKKKFVNPSTGKLDMRYNPLAHDEDFFVPSRGGKDSTRIEVLQGPDYAETDSLEYHRDKLVAALKVPKPYMGYGGEATRGSLSSEDIRFARTVMRIQSEMQMGYRKACRIHLVARGAENPDAHDYEVRMSVPSAIMELAKLEVMSATADLAERMKESVSTRWILTSLFKFTDEEAHSLMKEREEEQLQAARMENRVAKLGGGEEEAPPTQQQEPEDGAPPQEKAAPEAERRRHRGDPLVERQFAKMLSSHHRDWERSFDRKMNDVRKVDSKLQRLLANDATTVRRMRELGGLLSEIKGHLTKAA